MSMDERELLDLKKKVDQAKTTVSELTGQQKSLMRQLKDDWKCNTVPEAEKKLKGIKTEIENLENDIAESTKELEEKYNLIEE